MPRGPFFLMPSPLHAYQCIVCHAVAARWASQCAACKRWGTLQVVPEVAAALERAGLDGPLEEVGERRGKARALSTLADVPIPRHALSSALSSLASVLGGPEGEQGFAHNSVVLLAGAPGIGKTTLMTQAAIDLASAPNPRTVVYLSGEETEFQISERFHRMGMSDSLIGENVFVLCDRDIESIAPVLEREDALLILDSTQTLFSSLSEAAHRPGSMVQAIEVTARAMSFAKRPEFTLAVVLLCHVTKDGSVAGPEALQHLVDVVLMLEGDKKTAYRQLVPDKNRMAPFTSSHFQLDAAGRLHSSEPPEPKGKDE